ncbi:MAG: NfeD family protein [candidate division KSB1 bacterium]
MLESMNPTLLWFLVGLVLALAEFIVPGLIIIFFGAGAWVVALATGLGVIETFNQQLLVFLISSLLSLVLFRKHGQRFFEGRVTGVLAPYESLDDFQGGKAVVVAPIMPKNIGGKVEFNGTIWDAESEVEIAPGTTVQVFSRRDLTLKVKPLN